MFKEGGKLHIKCFYEIEAMIKLVSYMHFLLLKETTVCLFPSKPPTQ